ncbi:MAG TPA: hypothetical protein VIV40_01730 [Kofleriaceae bacterium]
MLHYAKFLFLLALASCALAPTSGSTTYTSAIDFDGFVDGPGLRVRLEAFDAYTNQVGTAKTVTADTAPSFAAGTICPNSPALYRYKGSLDLNLWIWWKLVNGTYEARVRAFKLTSTGETPILFTANPNPGSCWSQNAFNNTCDFNTVATKCGFKLGEATVKGVGSAPWNN